MPAPEIPIDFKFSSQTAKDFFFCNKRNICWNSGFGAGKSYALAQKLLALLIKFPGYRVAIGRKSLTDLKKTTQQTFFKVCPKEFYDEKFGGQNVQSPVAFTRFINGSLIYWVHLSEETKDSLRSLEINAAAIDQAEEIEESVFIELDNRVGRWDQVEIPEELVPYLPKNKMTGKPIAPSYHIILTNPPDEGEFSWIFQRFHPDSLDWQEKYRDSYAYFQSSSADNQALPEENLKALLTRDAEWVNRFVHGNFGRGQGAIHEISPLSILEVSEEWIKTNLLRKASLSRSLDHGASSPTACLWWATLNGCHFCYREYYVRDKTITYHRRAITSLSGDEYYVRNVADPSIFRKEGEKYGGFWTTALEYADTRDLQGPPPLHWSPGDNNEFATRNRINEYLAIDPSVKHPVTGVLGAPRIYYCKKTAENPNGCYHVIRETASQKKKKYGEINGQIIYGDEREESISDHSYDAERYEIATHIQNTQREPVVTKPNSFRAIQKKIKAQLLYRERRGY